MEECAEGLAAARLTGGRLARRILRGVTVLDDTYNANPDSMEAALQTLGALPVAGRRIAVLGRMGELGEHAAAGYQRVGRNAARVADALIAVGTETTPLSDTARAAGLKEVHTTADTAEAAGLLRKTGSRRRPRPRQGQPRRPHGACDRELLMLYYLYELGEWARKAGYESDFFKALNVFSYITFRAICAAATAFLISIIFGSWTIRQLISLKFGQPIRTKDEVNKLFELHGAKKGTPTMGGLLIIGSIVVCDLVLGETRESLRLARALQHAVSRRDRLL